MILTSAWRIGTLATRMERNEEGAAGQYVELGWKGVVKHLDYKYRGQPLEPTTIPIYPGHYARYFPPSPESSEQGY
jgi:hypothetical protein